MPLSDLTQNLGHQPSVAFVPTTRKVSALCASHLSADCHNKTDVCGADKSSAPYKPYPQNDA